MILNGAMASYDGASGRETDGNDGDGRGCTKDDDSNDGLWVFRVLVIGQWKWW